MITVKNRLNAPLVVNVPEQPAVYFLPKEIKVINNEQFNAPEMQRHIQLGNIIVLSIS